MHELGERGTCQRESAECDGGDDGAVCALPILGVRGSTYVPLPGLTHLLLSIVHTHYSLLHSCWSLSSSFGSILPSGVRDWYFSLGLVSYTSLTLAYPFGQQYRTPHLALLSSHHASILLDSDALLVLSRSRFLGIPFLL